MNVTTQATHSVREPQNWPHAFATYLEAGKLAEIVALYDPDARMVSPQSSEPDGELVVGDAAIRTVVAGLIQSGARLQCRVVRCVTSGDIAVLYTDFRGSMIDASGETRELRQRAIEVLRRGPDGDWKLIFGDPIARGSS